MDRGKADDALFDIECDALKTIESSGDFVEEHPITGQLVGIAVGLALGSVLVLYVLNPLFGSA